MNSNIASFALPRDFHTAAILLLALASAVVFGGCSHREEPGIDHAGNGAVIHHTGDGHVEPNAIPPRCTPAWNRLVNNRLHLTDSSGHGPRIGSSEWMRVVGRKSGVVDAQGHGPEPGSDEWCRAVDFKVFGRR